MDWQGKWKTITEVRSSLAARALETANEHMLALELANSLRVDLLLMESRADRAEAECERLKRLLRRSRPPKKQHRQAGMRRRRRR